MSIQIKHNHPLLLLGSPVGNKRKTNTLDRSSQYTGILYLYGHKILVRMPVFFFCTAQLSTEHSIAPEDFNHCSKQQNYIN